MNEFIEITEEKNNVQIRLKDVSSQSEQLEPYSEYYAIFSSLSSQRLS